MKAVVNWQGKVSFEVETGSGHRLLLDGPPAHGGENRGPRPMEMVLAGTGGCASLNVVRILEKARQQISDCRCELTAEREEGAIPAVFTRVHLHFVVTGPALKEVQVAKAINLTADKYCSAIAMLVNGGVEVTHSHALVAE